MADEKYSENAVDAAFSKIEEPEPEEGIKEAASEEAKNEGEPKPEAEHDAKSKKGGIFKKLKEQKEKLAKMKEEHAQKKQQKKEARMEAAKLRDERREEKKRLRAEAKAERKRRWEAGRKRRRRIFMVISMLIVLFLIAGGTLYYHYVEYFSSHFYKGTKINGQDVSYQSVADVKAGIEQDVAQYTLSIHTKDGVETLSANEIGWEYVDDKKVDALMAEQNPWKWVAYLSDSRRFRVSAGTTYNEKKVDAAIEGLDCLHKDVVEPIDAKLVEGADGTFAIEPEVEGNQVDADKLKTVIKQALDKASDEVDIVKDDCYVHPKIYSDDKKLVKRMEDWNKFMAISISYKFGSRTETVNAINLRPYIRDNGEKVEIATDWVSRLIYRWSQKYDSFGQKRKFKTHAGAEIELPEGGGYGWALDQGAMAADLIKCLNDGISGSREPIWLFKAKGWDNGGITGSYVEIDRAAQKLYLYEDGKMTMETDVVTGQPSNGTETEAGIFAISAKETDTCLDSIRKNETVAYWCPFNGNQGLCDASWRQVFGQNAYENDGTAGEIHIPAEKMQKIFEAVSVGEAVIIY